MRFSALAVLVLGVATLAAAQTTPWDYSGKRGELNWGKLNSIIFVIIHSVISCIVAGPPAAIAVILMAILPLACIWFPEELGEFTGFEMNGETIDKTSPAGMVWFMGWILLVLPLIVKILMAVCE